VPALFPDVALLHVHRADRFGNCQIDGYPHMDADMARAATTVIVTTEELVTEDEIRRRPDRTVIPGFLVDALVLAPFGAYPHEVWGRYHADFEHFAEYTADIDARGVPTAVADYLTRYVHEPATFEDYLELFGGERLKRARDAARELTPHSERA
jgi:glutaconate CoA-transferase subunit A